MARPKIDELVRKAIDVYNSYRGAEARSSVVDIDEDRILVKFEGHFCRTCGVYDWVEDFAYVMKDLGVEVELVNVIEPEDDSDWRIGVFRLEESKDYGKNE